MATDTSIRDDLVATLLHVDDAFSRVSSVSGPTSVVKPPDVHKTAEGLFLSAWTHWEEFVRRLFVYDLGTRTNGALHREIRKGGLRYVHSGHRLAELIVGHPDDGKWIEWSSITVVRDRADDLLGAGHRFAGLSATQLTDINRLKKIRNAVAHKSDKAWDDFMHVISVAPYGLTVAQRKFVTPGRLLAAHSVAGAKILAHSTAVLRTAAMTLVP